MEKISHLICRKIQAPLVSSLIREFIHEIGEERALEISRRVIERDAVQSGRSLADKYSGNSLKEMRLIVEEVWAEHGTMMIENLHLDEKMLSFDVTRCGYAEAYRQMGIDDLGVLLSCCRDFAFMEGFNPDIELVRTKTLMEGHECCNFTYVKKIS